MLIAKRFKSCHPISKNRSDVITCPSLFIQWINFDCVVSLYSVEKQTSSAVKLSTVIILYKREKRELFWEYHYYHWYIFNSNNCINLFICSSKTNCFISFKKVYLLSYLMEYLFNERNQSTWLCLGCGSCVSSLRDAYMRTGWEKKGKDNRENKRNKAVSKHIVT